VCVRAIQRRLATHASVTRSSLFAHANFGFALVEVRVTAGASLSLFNRSLPKESVPAATKPRRGGMFETMQPDLTTRRSLSISTP
jgi:hypothetical protein